MNNFFDLKGILDKKERTIGFQLRVLGVDLSVLLMGWVIPDWKLIDLRIPAGNGIFAQILFLAVFLGRLPDDSNIEVDSE